MGEQQNRSRAPRSPQQIQADLEATRRHLAHTVDSLTERLSPGSLAGMAVDRVRGVVVRPGGGVRTERLVRVAVGVVGTVAALYMLRQLVRRSDKRR